MKRASQELIWFIAVISIVFVISCSCSAQDKKKRAETRPEQTVLRQLHPEPVENDPPKGIRLLAGYKHKGATDFEGNQVGEISKPDGVKIKYEMGLSQGMAVDAEQRAAYVWYRDQKVNGRVTRYALNKSNVLMISIPLSDDPNSLHVANFYGTIKKPQDIADILLMVLPYAYD
jgi:hypothetical protein